MTITAKFRGTCSVCRGPIAVGEKIEWQKGKGSTHGSCFGKTPVPLNSAAPAEIISPDTDLAVEAAKFGRLAISDATIKHFTVRSMRGGSGKAGDVHLRKGTRYLTLASTTAQYLSADYLDDMDMFGLRAGWYHEESVVAVEPLEAELAAEREKEAARQNEILAKIRRSDEIIPVAQADGYFLRVSGSPERQAYIRAIASRARVHCGWLWLYDDDQYDAEFMLILRAFWDRVAPGWTHEKDGTPSPDSVLIALHKHSAVQNHLDGQYAKSIDSVVIDIARLEREYHLTNLSQIINS